LCLAIKHHQIGKLMAKKAAKNGDSAANLGFEAKLWLAADKLRNNMDAAEYKHVVLGLIFLKYISDAFEGMRAKLLSGELSVTEATCKRDLQVQPEGR
jgi:type I restriction enzyme M protein